MHPLLIATMKNEGPFLIEWVAWHRLIGFEDIIVAQNDSDDLTNEILMCLQGIGAIHYIDNSDSQGLKNHQFRAYRKATAHPVYKTAGWAMTLDADEFLAITVGDGQVKDLINELGHDVDQIHVHWSNIGSGGHASFKDELVTTRFTETNASGRIEKISQCFKTLYRTAAFNSAGIHRPHPENLDPDRAVTASGCHIDPEEMKLAVSKDPGGQKYARIFHYRIRDAESFVLAKMRGRPGVKSGIAETLGYWSQGDARARKDNFMSQQSDRILAEIARLNVRSNGQLLELHRASVARSKERIAAFKTNADLGAFYQEICRLQTRLRGPQERDALIELFNMGEIKWRPK